MSLQYTHSKLHREVYIIQQWLNKNSMLWVYLQSKLCSAKHMCVVDYFLTSGHIKACDLYLHKYFVMHTLIVSYSVRKISTHYTFYTIVFM